MSAFYPSAHPLVTERMRLRPLIETDVDALFVWQSDPESTLYLPYPPRSHEQVAEFVVRLAHQRSLVKDRDRVVFAAEQPSGGRVIGELHLVLADSSMPQCEVGWVFAKDVAGQGYATEAARAIMNLAFELGAHRVYADLDPRNTASARLCARLGMREEAHFVKNFRAHDGSWEDTGVWAVLAEEWKRP